MQTRRKPIFYAVFGLTLAALVAVCALLWGLSTSTRAVGGYPVLISEVVASNTRYPDKNGVVADYIELWNILETDVDISRLQLSDGGRGPRYSFPEGTVIPGRARITVTCGEAAEAPFGLSRAGGEKLRLLSPHGVILDEVQTVALKQNEAYYLAELGGWRIGTPTPGTLEVPPPDVSGHNPAVSPLRLSEIMSSNSAYPGEDGLFLDWIELENTGATDMPLEGYVLSDDTRTSAYSFPAGTTVPAGGFITVRCSSDDTGFALSRGGGELLVLKTPDGRVADIVETVRCRQNQSMALTDGRWLVTNGATPGFSNDEKGFADYLEYIGEGRRTVVVTEIMASNRATLMLPDGSFPDWVELYNVSNEAVDLDGWYLSDDAADPLKLKLTDMSLAPGQRTVVFLGGKSFSLSAAGESVVLTTPLGVTASLVEFGRQTGDVPLWVDPDTGSAVEGPYATPGFANDEHGRSAFLASLPAPEGLSIETVVPENKTLRPEAFGRCYDYVVIRNDSSSDAPLSGFALTKNTDAPAPFLLPDVTIAPGGSFTVLLSGNAALSTVTACHAGFRLDNVLDRLYLIAPDGSVADFTVWRDIPADAAWTRDGGYFHIALNGGGDSDG